MTGKRDGGHLVLLRGGLDDGPTGTDDADWRSFCTRIGWQLPSNTGAPRTERALPSDFEDRMLARILAEPEVAEDAVRASWPSFGPVSERRPRRSGAASTALVVAAIIGFAAAALLPLLAGPPSGTSPRPDPAARQVAPAPDVEPTAPTNSADAEERRAPKPEPSDTAQAPPPEPPGLLVARRARIRAQPAQERRAQDHAPAPIRPLEDAPPSTETPDESRVAFANDAPSGVAIAMGSILAGDRQWSRPVSWTEPRTDRSQLTSASWALTPEQTRWYGASLPPPGQPTDVESGRGIGVMAQVDLSKAIVAFEASRSLTR